MRDRVNWQAKINQILNYKRNRSYINTLATVLFILFMSLAGIIPAISSLSNQFSENAKRVTLINDLDNKLNGLKSLLLESEEKADLVEYFNNLFPEDINQDDMIKLTLSLASKSNVSIISFGFEDIKNLDRVKFNELVGENVGVLLYSISGSGSQTQVLDFLRRIEESALILGIQDLSVTKVLDEDTLNVTYGFDMNLFYFYYQRALPNE